MEKRELVALLNLSSWCLVMVGRLFFAVPRGCLRFVSVVYPDQTHLLFVIHEQGNTRPHITRINITYTKAQGKVAGYFRSGLCINIM